MPAPAIAAVVNAANYQPTVAPNTWITITGQNLAPLALEWSATDFVAGRLPTALEGVRVTVNRKSAFVRCVSATQINALTPEDSFTGQVNVDVTTAGGASTMRVLNAKRSPSLFAVGSGWAAAVLSDGLLALPIGGLPGATTRPARPGEIVQLFATGLNSVTNPHIPAGVLFNSPGTVIETVEVQIGGRACQVVYAGLVSPGLYQINAVVPLVETGEHVVQIAVGAEVANSLPRIAVSR